MEGEGTIGWIQHQPHVSITPSFSHGTCQNYLSHMFLLCILFSMNFPSRTLKLRCLQRRESKSLTSLSINRCRCMPSCPNKLTAVSTIGKNRATNAAELTAKLHVKCRITCQKRAACFENRTIQRGEGESPLEINSQQKRSHAKARAIPGREAHPFLPSHLLGRRRSA